MTVTYSKMERTATYSNRQGKMFWTNGNGGMDSTTGIEGSALDYYLSSARENHIINTGTPSVYEGILNPLNKWSSAAWRQDSVYYPDDTDICSKNNELWSTNFKIQTELNNMTVEDFTIHGYASHYYYVNDRITQEEDTDYDLVMHNGEGNLNAMQSIYPIVEPDSMYDPNVKNSRIGHTGFHFKNEEDESLYYLYMFKNINETAE